MPLSKHKRACTSPAKSTYVSVCVINFQVINKRSQTIPAMAPKAKTFLIVLVLVFIFISPSSGWVEGFRESQYRRRNLLYEDGMKMKSRKLLSHGFELDYDDAGPNPRHTRKPGKGT